MESTTKLERLLARNDYELQHVDNGVTLKSKGRTSKTIKLYYGFGILLTVFGLSVLLIFGSLWGLLFLSVSIPMFRQARRFSNDQKSLLDRILRISTEDITVVDGENSETVETSKISKIRYRFETSENLSTAKIFAIANGIEHHLLQIFNDDKRALDHDAQDIIGELKNLIKLNDH